MFQINEKSPLKFRFLSLIYRGDSNCGRITFIKDRVL